jgi:hypothetical protein
MSSGATPEEILVQALHQHGVRNPMPPLDPIGLSTRLVRADRLAIFAKLAKLIGVGAVVVALVAGVLVFNGSRNDDALNTTDSSVGASGPGDATTTTHKKRSRIVIDAQGNPIVIVEDDPTADDPNASSTTSVDGSSSTVVGGASSTNPGNPGNPGIPGIPGNPGDPNNPGSPGDTTHPPHPGHPNPTTAPTIPGQTTSSAVSTTTTRPAPTTTTTTAPPPPATACTGTMTPTTGTGTTNTVTIRGRSTLNGAPVTGGTVTFTWGRSKTSATTDINGFFSKTINLSTPTIGQKVTVRTTCVNPTGGPSGSFDQTFTRTFGRI